MSSNKGQTQQKSPTPQPVTPQVASPQPTALPTASLAAAGLECLRAGCPVEPRPEQVLALQRTAGNAAVQRLVQAQPMIQRVDEEETEASLDAAMLEVDGATIQMAGSVNARPGQDPNTADVLAPRVHFEARVQLAEGVRLGDGGAIEVGPVQTLQSSQRIGVYRQNGDPQGEILLEHHVETPTVRDAMYREEGGRREAIVPEPWYSEPVRVSSVHSGRDPTRPNVVQFEDQPGFTLEMEMAGGVLTETRGQDRFVTSLAAQRGETLVHLTNQQWEVPWALSIDRSGRGQGQPVAGGPSTESPSATSGEIAVNAREEWLSFTSVEAAMGAHANTLFFHLERTRQHDRPSWQYMVEALRLKNPTLQLTVGVRRPADPDIPFHEEYDEVNVRVNGGRQVERDLGQLAANESRSTQVHLLEIVDPATLTGESSIRFQVWDAGLVSHAPASSSWSVPFSPQREMTPMSGGEGSYFFSAEFLDTSTAGGS